MNRDMFMSRLKELLSDLSEAERDEALSYYEEYFEDAGAENEESVIASLGTPEKVAATIKSGLSEEAEEEGEFSETGYSNTYYETRDEVALNDNSVKNKCRRGFGNLSTGGWIIILILCVFALPILGPLLIGIGSAVLGLLIAIAAIFFAVLVAGVAMVIAAIGVLVGGIITLFTKPIVGIALIGAALLVGGLGIVVTALGVWITVKVVPPLFRGVVELIRKPFAKKEA